MANESKKRRGKLFRREHEIVGFVDMIHQQPHTITVSAFRKLYRQVGRLGRVVRKKQRL